MLATRTSCPLLVALRPALLLPLMLQLLQLTQAGCGAEVDDPLQLLSEDDPSSLAAALRAQARARAQSRGSGVPRRVIFIAIDSLHPGYLDLDALAAGQGQDGDWLMPWVRAFVKASSQWPEARAHFPQATDINHLNILAGSNSGSTGVVGVNVQPERWEAKGLELGRIHLAKARDRDGDQVKTVFDLLEEATGGAAVTAFIGNKNWVPREYAAGFGKGSTVDITVTGSTYPGYLPAPRYLSFHDNPLTDPDHACDPESELQVRSLDSQARKHPDEHPRDRWIADAAVEVMQREQPEMMYVLLADLDHAQHALGAVADPSEWVAGPAPKLPKGCQQKPHYRLVSRRNTRLYKEPILDLIRDVDRAFGALMVDLLKGGHLRDAAVVLVSDHNMVNYLYRDQIFEKTDVRHKLVKAGLANKKDFFLLGVGSVGLLYWRPEYKAKHPGLVDDARRFLLSGANLAQNHVTGALELPWAVMDRQDMQQGRAELGIGAGELYNDHFVQHGVWPDLALVMQHGWQIPSGAFNIGGGAAATAFNAGHGAPDTAAVMTAIWGLGFPAGVACAEAARLADVGATVARQLGRSLPDPLGRALACTPQ